ncbi:MAG TPA: acyl-CoA dehydrogenase family protein, partial [Acidimicrobiales bacterium]|nr:acyl-CoA dehydrogenase family protein [Acidimicrobiales bacterium]
SGSGSGGVDRIGGSDSAGLIALARQAGRWDDPVVRQLVVRLWGEEQIRRWTNGRVRTGLRAGRSPGPESSIGKAHQGELNQRIQLAACDLLGVSSTAWVGDDRPAEVKGMLRSRANTIEGGTTEVNKNVLGEPVLGLPREPDPWREVAWSEVPRS